MSGLPGPGRDTTEGRVYTVTGADWDDVGASRGDERIVVNMGPQHPSTHGVLRLILELDGETVTEARVGIGYLHTGIEKNCEYRNCTQGVTFLTRADYLSPFFNETAYCLAVEKLLGIEEQVPERAQVIRVMLMELNRVASHLVWLATGGMELGAVTGMLFGFRERELILDIFEMVTGSADEPRVRPPRWRLAGPAAGHRREGPRNCSSTLRPRLPEYDRLLTGQPIWQARLKDTGLPRPHRRASRSASPARCCARPGCPGTCARRCPTSATRRSSSTCRPRPTGDNYARFLVRMREMRESLKIVEQCARPAAPGPVMVADKKVAWPAQLALGGDGLGNSLDHIRHIMGESMEALIHHFKLVTEGFRVPAGPGLRADRVAARRAGLPPRVRRRHPALPRALPRPVVHQPAGGRGRLRGRPDRRCHRDGRESRPGHGWGGPLDAVHRRDTRAAPARSSRATRSRGRRCCRCCTWCSPKRAT